MITQVKTRAHPAANAHCCGETWAWPDPMAWCSRQRHEAPISAGRAASMPGPPSTLPRHKSNTAIVAIERRCSAPVDAASPKSRDTQKACNSGAAAELHDAPEHFAPQVIWAFKRYATEPFKEEWVERWRVHDGQAQNSRDGPPSTRRSFAGTPALFAARPPWEFPRQFSAVEIRHFARRSDLFFWPLRGRRTAAWCRGSRGAHLLPPTRCREV
jgi:hypothetical protein